MKTTLQVFIGCGFRFMLSMMLSGFGDVDDVMNDTNEITVVNQNQIKIGLYSRSGTSLVMVTVVTSLLWF